MRPESITVKLLADGEEIDSATLDESGDWAYTFEELDVYKDGEEIEYTVDEVEVKGYETEMGEVTGSAEDGYEVEITNSHTPKDITITVTKEWKDENDKDGLRPRSVSVQLYANGEPYGDPVKLSEKNGWTYTWKNLPKNLNGKKVTYTVDEVTVPTGYTKKISGSAKKGFTITNTHKVEPTPPPTPPTGDNTIHPVFWGTLAMISLLAMALLTFFRKKEDEV